MAYIRVEIRVSRVCDTELEVDELYATEKFNPKFTPWTILIILVGFLNTIKKEIND